MTKKPLTTIRIAYHNLRGREGRTVSLVIIVSIMAFALFGGFIISKSLENGMESLGARLGADIAVVPAGHEEQYEKIILDGSPVDFYIDRNIEGQISGIEGVEQVTAQFYIATLEDAYCCSTQVQIIGIDYDTDFVVKPWISQFLGRQINSGEIIVGSNLILDEGNTLTFFETVLPVAAKLDRTATGMDSTVYVNMETAYQLAKAAMAVKQDGIFDFNSIDSKDAASAILVKVGSDYSVNRVMNYIKRLSPDVGLVASAGIYSSVASNLNFITGLIGTITVTLGFLIILVLAVLFSLIAGSRKKEFAIIRVLGATQGKLAGIVLAESVIISICGAIFGSLLAALIVYPFGRSIGQQMGLPLLLPGLLNTIYFLITSIIISIAVGPLSASYSAFKISRAETYATMREGE